MGIGWLLGWSLGANFVFGLALSIASTVVLMRALQERRLLEAERGRVAAGWLVVKDLMMVLALILLPPLATLLRGDMAGGTQTIDFGALGEALAITFAKVAAALMLLAGRRAIPLLLHCVAHTGSRHRRRSTGACAKPDASSALRGSSVSSSALVLRCLHVGWHYIDQSA
jgi:monovalent cation:H+ antiporter-2, CPA2 family